MLRSKLTQASVRHILGARPLTPPTQLLSKNLTNSLLRYQSTTTATTSQSSGSSPEPTPLSSKTRPKTTFKNSSVKTLNESPLIIHNKKYSESGKLLTLKISANAIRKLQEIAQEDQNDKLALKISVESGGCHGFQYNLHLVDLDESQLSQIASNSATVAQEQDEDLDCIFEKDNTRIIIDSSSLQILQDSTVDYTTELIGSMFKVIDSPYTSSACGCGSSFDVDFDKIGQ
ncbi:hypothetical protein WICPIJ_001100 [Wickerhamomyces pijperi]|uniref:Core domain-containing protein n=1 Tax=Wickerhamomyces pijperi TaxID=599730 RepID=A0A9P8QE64_WICPI|nr:hypothetical protein WICPIJ_001100 [Wickerhamomyces pijperi]